MPCSGSSIVAPLDHRIGVAAEECGDRNAAHGYDGYYDEGGRQGRF
jgi:hypothetical protein